MKKILITLFLISTAVYAADKVIINPAQDEDTVFKVNNAGSAVEVMRLNATGNSVEITTLTSPGGGAVSFPGGASGISAQITDLTLGAVVSPVNHS